MVTKFNRFFSQCYLSIIVVSELYKGIYCSQQVAKNLEILAQLTELLPVEPLHIELVLTVNRQPSTVNRQLSTVNCQQPSRWVVQLKNTIAYRELAQVAAVNVGLWGIT
ncbi:hypothetical protein NIES22_03410 [Calothrix brevissima NIES-22]|nr:hypothetical protein NIES22_03410 [Calothrix brevissima NIES-22]